MRTPRSRTKAPEILQLKVSLLDLDPPVWRRLLVTANTTLAGLHFVLNEAMGWTNSHLHSFRIGERRFGDPALDPENELGFEDERKARLDAILTDVGSFAYDYDFGDGWRHEVVLEGRLPRDPRFAYPLCVGGARACPPEDCGGVPGYIRLLEALAAPENRRHDELITWIGGDYDPEGFDRNRTNTALHALGPR